MKRLAERGFTLIEIMIVVAIIALLAAVAIPSLLRGRTSANEAAAIGNTRALITSLEMYRSVNSRYPLGPGEFTPAVAPNMYPTGGAPAYGPPSFSSNPMTGAAASSVQGYWWSYIDTSAGGTGANYAIVARPATLNTTGTRSFFANESGQIRHCTGAATSPVTVALATSAAAACAGWLTCATVDAAPSAACP